MTRLARLAVFALALSPSFMPALAHEAPALPTVIASTVAPDKPVIQIAILLDTSGSMDGLIGQAKTQLWKIVNEFAAAQKAGVRPVLQVALYEYGKDSLEAQGGYLRQILPLTTDLDRVSEELFKLTTNGGSEYCGTAIKSATLGLAWSPSNTDYKAIFIAGNEPFTQGQVDYKESCKAAISKGIVVNTIFCGPASEGVSTNWKDGADLADGAYMAIDQNRAVVQIKAPQDAEIAKLGSELNSTYVAYGAAGAAGAGRQERQDANAAAASPSVAAERAVAKSSAQYRNAEWDLVDAVKEKKVELEKVDAKDLPESMRGLKPEERKAAVEKLAARRTELQEQIAKLSRDRTAYVAEEEKKAVAATGADTLDAAMIKALREQAAKRQFEVKK